MSPFRWTIFLLGVVAFAAAVLTIPASPRVADAAARYPSIPLAASLDLALEPGTLAIVRGDGDCLRLRASPGLSGQRLTCMPDGSSVLVLEGTVEADGFEWQRLQFQDQTGWAATEFLAPSPGEPSCGGAGATRVSSPGLTGTVPPEGVGLVLWGGGTVQGIATAAVAQGCNPRSVWANRPGGGFIGYIFGAPDFVNAEWFQLFGDGRVPAGTPLVLLCGGSPPAPAGPTSSSQSRSAGADIPLPRPLGDAPRLVSSEPPPEVAALGAVMIDEASGAVLFGQEEFTPLPPASLTKIVTAILAIEGSDLDGWALSNVDSRSLVGSSLMGLLPGDCFPVRDLLRGLLLPSGNDAALSLGRHISGSDEVFVRLMNTLVAQLGLQNTHFTDPHGLGSEQHLSSAYDLAMLARYAMTLPEFAEAVATPAWTAVGSRTIPLRNVNRFLSQYQGADGVKTGFTGEAGRTLIASATRDGHRVYVVLLNAPDRFDDAERLLDWAFASFAWS